MTIAQSTTIQAYQLRLGGSRARMAILRMIAADSVRNPNESTRLSPGDWRKARSWRMDNYEACYGTPSLGLNGRETVLYTHTGEVFRNERDAGDIVSSLSAYYTDEHRDEKAYGIVASLPHGRFIAGYRWTSNDERVYFTGEVFTDKDDAARMADEHARVFAEHEQEYDASSMLFSWDDEHTTSKG